MKTYHVLNLGAGVQSTALYLLSREPDARYKFDAAVFADTQEEPAAVYTHLEWLKSLDSPPIHTGTAGKLGDDLIHGRPGSATGGFSSIPCFTAEDHRTRLRFCAGVKEGMVRRQCTYDYKIRVCEKVIRYSVLGLKPRSRIPKGVHVRQYFGITTDESRRAVKGGRRFDRTPWASPVYPFLEMGWSRIDCLKYLKDKVPHRVPKSACVFCPFRSNSSWQHLKDADPEGWTRAVEIDRKLREEGSVCNRGFMQSLYLHRKCIPLDQVDLGKPDEGGTGLAGECEGMCGV